MREHRGCPAKLLGGRDRSWFRSTDLWVMGPARFRCANPEDENPKLKITPNIS
ncbi:hypothetical protein J6590_100560 [Homalodisca vitripennis]|nr:hypothetical protein J6590_100560 [Homalodisca vitripennis]